MHLNVAVIAGDGIGPEITAQACKVVERAAALGGHSVSFQPLLMGGCSIDVHGVPLTDETIEAARSAQAVLMGSIGGAVGQSSWYSLPPQLRPEAGLLKLRKALGLFCNLRPAVLYPELAAACPLRSDLAEQGFDLMIVRELTGGLYFGERKTETVDGSVRATDTLVYHDYEIRRIVRKAAEIAMGRGRRLVSVDKANVLDSSRLWRRIAEEEAASFPGLELEHMLVDNCAMQLVKNPARFDVLVTENMFGDILSDEASEISGSIGMLPSASLREDSFGLYEPSHGSAPDIAGQDLANPLATILSAAMMLRYSFGLSAEADRIEAAVRQALRLGLRTADIMAEGCTRLSCTQMGDTIVELLS